MASWLKFGTAFVRSDSGPKLLTRALLLSHKAKVFAFSRSMSDKWTAKDRF